MHLHSSSLLLGVVTAVGLLAAESTHAEPGWSIDVARLSTISVTRTGEGAPKASILGQAYGVGQEVSINGQSLRIFAIDETSVTLQHDREFARIAINAGTAPVPAKSPSLDRLTTPESFQREVARLLTPGMQVRLEPVDESAPGLVIEGRVAGEGDRPKQAQEFLERLQARIREDFPGASASFRTLGDDAEQKVTRFTMWLSPDAREPQRADELLRLFR